MKEFPGATFEGAHETTASLDCDLKLSLRSEPYQFQLDVYQIR